MLFIRILREWRELCALIIFNETIRRNICLDVKAFSSLKNDKFCWMFCAIHTSAPLAHKNITMNDREVSIWNFCLWIEMLYLNNDYFTCRSIHAAQVNDVWICKKWQESSSWIISHCKHATIFMCWVNQKCIARHKVRHNRFGTLEMKRQINKCRFLVTNLLEHFVSQIRIDFITLKNYSACLCFLGDLHNEYPKKHIKFGRDWSWDSLTDFKQECWLRSL